MRSSIYPKLRLLAISFLLNILQKFYEVGRNTNTTTRYSLQFSYQIFFRISATNSPRVCELELTVNLQKNVQIIKFSVIDEPRHLSRSCLPPFLPTLANPNLIKQTKSPKKGSVVKQPLIQIST